MGGLSHYLEDEGLATTQVSLIREHTEKIKPPRALWVPFELGRPFGPPNDAAFQTRVLVKVLRLLQSPQGPVLEDFNAEAPLGPNDGGPLACPVDFSTFTQPVTESEQRLIAFRQEFSQMRSWYDLARKERKHSTAAASGLSTEELIDAIANFLTHRLPICLASDVSPGTALKMAVEDLKAYYFEAVIIQPGQPTDSATLADWFWGQTAAAKIISQIRTICAESNDDAMKRTAHLLIPKAQLHRFE